MAKTSGIPRDETARFLSSTDGVAEILAAQRLLRALGIHSIPTFLVSGEQMASGALNPCDLTRALCAIDAASEHNGRAATQSIFADSLNIPTEILSQTLTLP